MSQSSKTCFWTWFRAPPGQLALPAALAIDWFTDSSFRGHVWASISSKIHPILNRLVLGYWAWSAWSFVCDRFKKFGFALSQSSKTCFGLRTRVKWPLWGARDFWGCVVHLWRHIWASISSKIHPIPNRLVLSYWAWSTWSFVCDRFKKFELSILGFQIFEFRKFWNLKKKSPKIFFWSVVSEKSNCTKLGADRVL